MAEGSTIAEKLLETLARQRAEGLLSDEEYSTRVEQLVRVPAPVGTAPVPKPEAAPVSDDAAPENGESGGSTPDSIVSEPPPANVDARAPAQVAESPAPVEDQLPRGAEQGRRDTREVHVEAVQNKVTQPAVGADPVPAPEGPEATGPGTAEAQTAPAPQPRRRRFARKAKVPAAAEIEAPAPPPAGLPALGGMSEERVAELKDKLLELEMEGWQAVAEYRACGFYSNRLADDGLLVLPDGSVLDKWEAAVSALNGDDTWTSYRFQDERLVVLATGCAALTYTASAQIMEEPEYRAVITSVFVRRGDEWLIALRQETPIQLSDDPS